MGNKTVNNCKYCGTNTYNGKTICSSCGTKLKLVRQLLAMVKDYKERYGQ